MAPGTVWVVASWVTRQVLEAFLRMRIPNHSSGLSARRPLSRLKSSPEYFPVSEMSTFHSGFLGLCSKDLGIV